MGQEKLFGTDTELAYGEKTQERDKQLLSWTGSIKDGAVHDSAGPHLF